jgi:hypothetical protein
MAAVNPKIVDFKGGRIGLEIDSLPIGTAQTWKAGQFLIYAASAYSTAASGDIPTHIAVDDQTAPTAGTIVNAYRLKKGVRLEMYALTGAVGVANLNAAYDLDVTSNICTVDLGNDTDACFKVVRLSADYEPSKNATADDPGKCIIEIAKVA